MDCIVHGKSSFHLNRFIALWTILMNRFIHKPEIYLGMIPLDITCSGESEVAPADLRRPARGSQTFSSRISDVQRAIERVTFSATCDA